MKTKTILTVLILSLLTLNVSAQDFPYISLGGHTDAVQDVVFSSDGKTVASGSYDRTVRVWEVSTGNQISTIRNPIQQLPGANSVNDIALSSDGKIVAGGSPSIGNSTLNIWMVSTGERLWGTWDSHGTEAVAFNPDGQTIADGGYDHTVDIWEVSSGKRLRTLIGHTGAILQVAFSPDGQLFASASRDDTVRLWEVSAGYRHLHTLEGHTNDVSWVAFSPDGQMVATSSGDHTVKLWNVRTGRLVRTLTGHTDWVNTVAISPDGQTVVSGSADATICLWEMSTGRHLRTLNGHSQPVHSVAFSPTEQKFASGHEDGSLLLWELPTTHVRIVPAYIVSPAVGEQVTVNLNIVAGEDVAAYEVSLTFDETALRYVSSANGDYLPAGAYFVPPVTSENTITLGSITLAGTSNGDGTLATVTFEVVDPKDSFIDISHVTLTDSNEIEIHSLAHSTRIEAFIFGDINRDEIVNIQDLVLVARSFGQIVPAEGNPADVNNDGVVNILDLVQIAGAFGTSAAAPMTWNQDHVFPLTRSEVQQWLMQAQQANLTDPISRRGILFLEQLLAALTPQETALLANYPNPFNPETWIPYQLAKPADVTVTIYASDGTLVRKLDLGHQPVGLYQSRKRAAHWDGKNAVEEAVASGVYYYTLTAGDFSATRKMLILK